jgi:hypothetical protein
MRHASIRASYRFRFPAGTKPIGGRFRGPIKRLVSWPFFICSFDQVMGDQEGDIANGKSNAVSPRFFL